MAPIGERSIPAVFARKFGGPGAGIYLRSLLGDRAVPEQERQATVRPAANAVACLRHLAASLPSVPDTVVLGNLTPQHIHLAGWRPRFTAPARRPAAGPDADITTLTGRTLLLASTRRRFARQPGGEGRLFDQAGRPSRRRKPTGTLGG